MGDHKLNGKHLRQPAQQVTFKAPRLCIVGPYIAPESAYVLEASPLEPSAVKIAFDPELPADWLEFIACGMVRFVALAPNGMFAEYFIREARIKTPEELAKEAAARVVMEASEAADKTDPGVGLALV